LDKLHNLIWNKQVLLVIPLSKQAKGVVLLMDNNKVVKSVAFNKANDQDKECLEHIEKANFSGYVKDLIFADIQKRKEGRKIIHRSTGGGIKIVLDNTPTPSEVLM
jgi:hypothetical protein